MGGRDCEWEGEIMGGKDKLWEGGIERGCAGGWEVGTYKHICFPFHKALGKVTSVPTQYILSNISILQKVSNQLKTPRIKGNLHLLT